MRNPRRELRPLSHQFCRRAKIRVTAHPRFRAARFTSLFPAGFESNEAREMLPSWEQPRPHGFKPREAIVWRIRGERDAQPEGSRLSLSKL